MTRPIAIILGEPNSISSEIIFKLWTKRKKFRHFPFLVIGNYKLLLRHLKYFKYNIKLKLIKNNFKLKDLKGSAIPIIDIKYKQKKIFEDVSQKSNKFIFNCFSKGFHLLKQKKIFGIINGPVSKNTLLNKKFNGITEFIAHKFNLNEKIAMLIYTNKIAVCPITTHIPIKKVSSKLNSKIIITKIKTIANFYKKNFNKKVKIGITGLNPHCYSGEKNSEEKQIIYPAIRKLRKQKINVSGPYSADTIFLKESQEKFDLIVGMYHDQVLTPIKTIMGFKAINITVGLPFIRISPDHGIASNIVGKKVADPSSLIECVKFFNFVK